MPLERAVNVGANAIFMQKRITTRVNVIDHVAVMVDVAEVVALVRKSHICGSCTNHTCALYIKPPI